MAAWSLAAAGGFDRGSGPASVPLDTRPGLFPEHTEASVPLSVSWEESARAFAHPREMIKTSGSHEGVLGGRTLLAQLPNSAVFLAPSDYVVQFEEDQFQPGVWHDHSKFPGSVNSAVLQLSPYVNYQFRVIAINEVGSSHPSLPSERYRTSGAREYPRADGPGAENRCPEVKRSSPSFWPQERTWAGYLTSPRFDLFIGGIAAPPPSRGFCLKMRFGYFPRCLASSEHTANVGYDVLLLLTSLIILGDLP